jgi:hypothetical protein
MVRTQRKARFGLIPSFGIRGITRGGFRTLLSLTWLRTEWFGSSAPSGTSLDRFEGRTFRMSFGTGVSVATVCGRARLQISRLFNPRSDATPNA